MQALKPALAILLVVAFVTWVSKWKDSLQHQLPARFADKVRADVKTIAATTLMSYASTNQNPLVSLLRHTQDDIYLTRLRQWLSDDELADMTRVDVAALSNAVKMEQNKAFQRVIYFLPPRMGQEAYMQWFFPETRIPGMKTSNGNNNNNNGNTNAYTNANNAMMGPSNAYNNNTTTLPATMPTNANPMGRMTMAGINMPNGSASSLVNNFANTAAGILSQTFGGGVIGDGGGGGGGNNNNNNGVNNVVGGFGGYNNSNNNSAIINNGSSVFQPPLLPSTTSLDTYNTNNTAIERQQQSQTEQLEQQPRSSRDLLSGENAPLDSESGTSSPEDDRRRVEPRQTRAMSNGRRVASSTTTSASFSNRPAFKPLQATSVHNSTNARRKPSRANK